MVAMNADLEAREQELYAVIQAWPDVSVLTIGGYAASAWSFPRFSHDLDFIVPEQHATILRQHFESHDLAMVRDRPEIEQNYGGSWERWQGPRHGATIDLLVNSVQDRDFQVPTTFAELWKDHSRRHIRGITESGVRLPVISKEALLALKVQPMRARDIGDICSLAYTGFDAARLRELLGPVLQIQPALLRERLDRLETALGSSPSTLQQALGPRIRGFARIRNDMAVTMRRFISLVKRWTNES